MPTLIDAHVHVHAAGDAAALLDAALANFTQAAARLSLGDWRGALLLSEMKQTAWFESVVAAGAVSVGKWQVTADPEDALLLRARGHGQELLVIAGRQVVTAEGVEVLTLATRERLPDGQSLDQTLRAASMAGALAVLPWAAGKWLGARGRLVNDALRRQQPAVSAGDSGGRPAWWPVPQLALATGRPVISGTDPLPIRGDLQRVGSFGSWIAATPPASRPGAWLRDRLAAAQPGEVQPFGAPLPSMAFVRSQVALRVARQPIDGAMPVRRPGEPETPDIETSSAGYARRFSGRAGRYLLDVQSRSIEKVLRGLPPGRALDVGGGHGQLVDQLRRLGWEVTVHGTDPVCEQNLRELHGKRECGFALGPVERLPAADRSYDLVIAVRLISHVDEWPRVVAEMCRVASRAVVIDYPSTRGLNALTPLLFGVKKYLEGNTRTYTSFSRQQLLAQFSRHGFDDPRLERQFFMPMVVHRVGKAVAPLRWMEAACRALGLTGLAGSPVILRVDRK